MAQCEEISALLNADGGNTSAGQIAILHRMTMAANPICQKCNNTSADELTLCGLCTYRYYCTAKPECHEKHYKACLAEAGISLCAPGYHDTAEAHRLPRTEGRIVVTLGGKDSPMSLSDLLICKRIAEGHGGFRIISCDMSDQSFLVDTTLEAIGAIQEKSLQDEAERHKDASKAPV